MPSSCRASAHGRALAQNVRAGSTRGVAVQFRHFMSPVCPLRIKKGTLTLLEPLGEPQLTNQAVWTCVTRASGVLLSIARKPESQDTRRSATAAHAQKAAEQQQVTLDTGNDCQLAVAFWPMFTYDASSGSSPGVSTRATREGRKVRLIDFEPRTCGVPPLDWKSTKILGIVPLPPPIQICIDTKELSGWIDEETGQAELTFDALFSASAGSLYRPPPLRVKTVLSTEGAKGQFQSAEGKRFTDGRGGTLVGVATVPKTGEWIIDTFLQLPNEAFALLTADINPVVPDST